MCFNIRNIHSSQVVLVLGFLVFVFGTYYYGIRFFVVVVWNGGAFFMLGFFFLQSASNIYSDSIWCVECLLASERKDWNELCKLWVWDFTMNRITTGKLDESKVISLGVAKRWQKNVLKCQTNEIEWMFWEIDKIKTEAKKGRIQQLFPFPTPIFFCFGQCFFPLSISRLVFLAQKVMCDELLQSNAISALLPRIYSNNFFYYLFIYVYARLLLCRLRRSYKQTYSIVLLLWNMNIACKANTKDFFYFIFSLSRRPERYVFPFGMSTKVMAPNRINNILCFEQWHHQISKEFYTMLFRWCQMTHLDAHIHAMPKSENMPDIWNWLLWKVTLHSDVAIVTLYYAARKIDLRFTSNRILCKRVIPCSFNFNLKYYPFRKGSVLLFFFSRIPTRYY